MQMKKVMIAVALTVGLVSAQGAEARRMYANEGPYLVALVKERYLPLGLTPEETCLLFMQVTSLDLSFRNEDDFSVTFVLQERDENGNIVGLSTLYRHYWPNKIAPVSPGWLITPKT